MFSNYVLNMTYFSKMRPVETYFPPNVALDEFEFETLGQERVYPVQNRAPSQFTTAHTILMLLLLLLLLLQKNIRWAC